MRMFSIGPALLSLALLASACGGPDRAQSTTLTVDDVRYELVAVYGEDVDHERVTALLARATAERVLEDRGASIDDPGEGIVLELVPLDTSPTEQPPTVAIHFSAPTAEPPKEKTSETPADETEGEAIHAAFSRPGSIKGATDPDVDPARPR